MLPRCGSAPLRLPAGRKWDSEAEQAQAGSPLLVRCRLHRAGTERSPGKGRGCRPPQLNPQRVADAKLSGRDP
eukprot:507054-Alexandrium_andersonii.AAC.1